MQQADSGFKHLTVNANNWLVDFDTAHCCFPDQSMRWSDDPNRENNAPERNEICKLRELKAKIDRRCRCVVRSDFVISGFRVSSKAQKQCAICPRLTRPTSGQVPWSGRPNIGPIKWWDLGHYYKVLCWFWLVSGATPGRTRHSFDSARACSCICNSCWEIWPA